jgi:hypothetical protein
VRAQLIVSAAEKQLSAFQCITRTAICSLCNTWCLIKRGTLNSHVSALLASLVANKPILKTVVSSTRFGMELFDQVVTILVEIANSSEYERTCFYIYRGLESGNGTWRKQNSELMNISHESTAFLFPSYP